MENISTKYDAHAQPALFYYIRGWIFQAMIIVSAYWQRNVNSTDGDERCYFTEIKFVAICKACNYCTENLLSYVDLIRFAMKSLSRDIFMIKVYFYKKRFKLLRSSYYTHIEMEWRNKMKWFLHSSEECMQFTV